MIKSHAEINATEQTHSVIIYQMLVNTNVDLAIMTYVSQNIINLVKSTA